MKRLLLTILPLLLALCAFGANPPYTAFLGTNGILVISNSPSGKILIDGSRITNGSSTIFFTSNLFTTNLTAQSITVLGTISGRVVTLPTVAGLGWFNGTNQWYSTNLTANVAVLLTNLMEGADYYLQVSNPASFAVTFTSIGADSWIEHPYVAGTAATNAITLFKFQRWGTKTNAFEVKRSLTLTNDDGSITFVTNQDTLVIRAAPGGITFGDLVWTNDNNDITVISTITTNIHFSLDGSMHIGPEITNGVFIDLSNPSIKSINVDRPNANSTLQADDNGFAMAGAVNAAEGGSTRFDVFGIGDTGGSLSSVELALQIANRYVVLLDPTYSVGPTSYLFSSAYGVTNTDTLLSLQNSNTPMFEVNGIGDLKLLKRVPYSWPSAQGAAQTVLTNDGAGNLGWGTAGAAGSVGFANLVWTNNTGTLYPVAYPTNIILNPTNTGSVSALAHRTNFLFQTSTRRIGGTNTLFAVMNGGASAFVVGDQGIMIGSTNYITVPQMAIDIAYDTAFGVDTPDKGIVMTSYNSVVGYSGTTEFNVGTNYGRMILNANKEGNGQIQLTEQTGGDVNFINYDLYLQVFDPNNTLIVPYQIDPDFSLSPTGYIFGSTMRVTNIHTLMSLQNSNTPVFEVNGIGDLKLLKRIAYSWPSAQGAAATVLTNDGSGNLGWGTAAAVSPLAGTTNVLNLSVQAAKLPATNYPSIDAGWQAWETVYAETNSEGARIATSAIWQFVVPPDYATNTLKLLINYSLSSTNGPNTSNVVFGVSVLPIRSGTTNNVHTNFFGAVVRGSNDWIAKYDGTNIVTNLVIDLGVNSLLMPRDVGLIKLQRLPTEDTYDGAVAVHGLQLEYTRP